MANQPTVLGPKAAAVVEYFETWARTLPHLSDADEETLRQGTQDLLQGYLFGIGSTLYDAGWARTAYEEFLSWRAQHFGSSPDSWRTTDRSAARTIITEGQRRSR
jgi:hypothetical protein